MATMAHDLPERRPELPGTAAELLPLVYHELRRLAAEQLAHERPGQTLQATALVHEAWLRVENSPNRDWQSRAHFFRTAAQAMRRILVENARRKQALKRGGDFQRATEDVLEIPMQVPEEHVVAVDEALDELAAADPAAAELVQLRFFVGVPHQEAAEILGLSRSGADRLWVYARAWLADKIKRI